VISPHVNTAPDVAAGAAIVAKQTPEAFVDAIATLLADPSERAALGRRARAFARRHDWAAVAGLLAQMYFAAAGRPRA
jgi:glycosyltransferase involved in cell wall biosynthesis